MGAATGAVRGHLRRDLGRAVVVVAVPDFRFRGTSGSLVGRSGLLSVYSSAPGLGSTTWIEQRPWGLQSAPLVVICGVIWAVPWW